LKNKVLMEIIALSCHAEMTCVSGIVSLRQTSSCQADGLMQHDADYANRFLARSAHFSRSCGDRRAKALLDREPQQCEAFCVEVVCAQTATPGSWARGLLRISARRWGIYAVA